jgi:hypothetical protein
MHTLEVNARTLPVRFRRHARARRMSLRFEAKGDGIVVTLPARVSERRGWLWVQTQTPWIAARHADRPAHVPFVHGQKIPVAGTDHMIHHVPAERRGVCCADGIITVGGQSERVPRRVRHWLRAEALRRLGPMVQAATARLGTRAGRVSVRDTRTRWGSCSASGNLSFCWRLVMAPEYVFDYVVAHEVAHLREANHGPAFWRLVAALTPHVDAGRTWLREHGEGLHFYG